jgi:hypothetical protein
LERSGRKGPWPVSRYHPSVCEEKLIKIKNEISIKIFDAEYNTGVLTTTIQYTTLP